MSKLALHSRPYVLFDPADVNHRRWFGEFCDTNSWGKCPVRFVSEEPGELMGIMHRKLISYYTKREFKKKA